jgi:hypothetical protein
VRAVAVDPRPVVPAASIDQLGQDRIVVHHTIMQPGGGADGELWMSRRSAR